MNVYPIFLNNLRGRRCVVIGGDHEAERKAKGLLECDGAVEVISPEVTEALQQWAEAGRLEWKQRDYQRGDLKGAFLVIVSETNPPKTQPVWQESQEEGVLINAMDDIPHCTFVAGSVVRQGDLVFSISTSGAAPALSVRIREAFEEKFGPEYGVFLALMKSLREPMKARFPDFGTRKERWYALVDSDILALLKVGDVETAYQRIEELTGIEVTVVVGKAR